MAVWMKRADGDSIVATRSIQGKEVVVFPYQIQRTKQSHEEEYLLTVVACYAIVSWEKVERKFLMQQMGCGYQEFVL